MSRSVFVASLFILTLCTGLASAQEVTNGPLPAPWTYADVGSVGLAGGATYSNSFYDGATFTVRSAGADIWGTADSFGYVYAPFSGDGWVIDTVRSLQNTNTFAKAGLMLRESLDPSSPEVIVDVRPTGDIEFMTRDAAGHETTFIAGAVHSAPVELELYRDGSTVTALYFSDSAQKLVPIGSVTVAMSQDLLAGLVVTSHDTGALNTAVTRVPLTHNFTPSAFPFGFWTDSDVGAVGINGGSTYDNGVFTVRGAGADIWGTSDSFHIVRGPSNAAVLIARVTSLDNTNTFAKAGLDMRLGRGASPQDSHVIIDVRPTGGVEFMTRSVYGQEATFINGAQLDAPVWLKLEMTWDQTISGSVSSDGVNWTVVGSATPDWANMNAGDGWVTPGLIVCSHDTSQLATAAFDNVAVFDNASSSLPRQWTYAKDVGATGQAGSASWAAGTITVNGAGSDIWGTSDSFFYVFRQANCGCPGYAPGEYPETHAQVTARVTSIENTNTFAKAGVMLRTEVGNPFNGVDPSSADVILDVRPTGDIEFMSRGSDGGETAFIAGAQTNGPVWLRLTRMDDVISGYLSEDGVAWTLVGTVTAGVSSDAVLAGLAVTSHDSSQMNTATFDNAEVIIPQ